METGYLNFHDAEHFSDFELPLDQHDLLDDPESSLMAIVDTDFDYIESMDTSGGLWETEQELNGDLAVLPDSGVASVIPKIENIKEDFAKVLSDWQEHIGYMQASDFEEDIDMSAINIHMPDKLNTDLPDEIFQSEITHSSPEKKSHMTIISPEQKISPSSPLIDLKPILTNLSIFPDEILQSKSPVRTVATSMISVMSPEKLNKEPHKSPRMESNIQSDCKMEIEDCVDIETVSEHEPVLEAGDVKSLLEQFEASEVGLSQPIISTETKSVITKDNPNMKNKKGRADRSELTLLKKCIQSPESKLHRNIRDSLPKEIIDRIKESGRKKVMSVISATSDPTKYNRTNRINDTRLNSGNKSSKILSTDINIANRIDGSVQLDHDYCSNSNSAATKSNYDEVSKSRKKTTANKHPKSLMTKDNKPVRRRAMHKKNLAQSTEIWRDSSSKKDSGLESGDVSDASEEPIVFSSVSNLPIATRANHRAAQMYPKSVNNSIIISNDETTIKPPLYEMKIRSALATSILQLRDSVLTKTKSIENGGVHKPIHMVSVLKKPPVNTNIITKNNPNESIVTTKNSSNDEVQNIIIQGIPATVAIENEKKPARRKLNLAEYRSRRDQGKSDTSRTCSPIPPMTLVYIHHASTTTEPIKDDPTNLIWSEREIVSVLKPKCEIEEDINHCSKPASCEVSTQTNDSPFSNTEKITTQTVTTTSTSTEAESPASATTTRTATSTTTTAGTTSSAATSARIIGNEVSEKEESRVSRLHERKQRNYRQKHRSSSGSNRSRSRSRSQSRSSRSADSSRTRSQRRRSSRNRSRSLSRRRTRKTRRNRSPSSSSRSASRSRSVSRRRNARRRRISHRRSSVSSSSTWSSRSRSRSRSTYRSRSQSTSSSYSRSRSSRSRSSSRYSSCSRTSSQSNLDRSKCSSQQRRVKCDRRTGYDRRSRCSSRSIYDYRYYRCLRSSSYRRPHDVWCHQEKKRQVEERRVIYVGRLEETITKADLRRRFEAFGPVLDISLHFREHGDNYGFVTFAYKNDAYEAVEHGNDDPSLSRYDLCFGGRRAFCKVKYADLDGMASNSLGGTRNLLKADEDNTFDLLLKQAKAKLRNRKV